MTASFDVLVTETATESWVCRIDAADRGEAEAMVRRRVAKAGGDPRATGGLQRGPAYLVSRDVRVVAAVVREVDRWLSPYSRPPGHPAT